MKVTFAEFIKHIVLSYPSRGWDKDDFAIIDIRLSTKKDASFKFKFKADAVRFDDWVADRNTLAPIQIKEKIYNEYYLTSKQNETI